MNLRPSLLLCPNQADPFVQILLQRLDSRRADPELDMLQSQLPVASWRQEILSAVNMHSVVVIAGETGCGKSTQIPQYLLEDEIRQGRACNIVVVQPRRVAAITLAERVAYELRMGPMPREGHTQGDESCSPVGYAVRLLRRVNMYTRLLFCTTGILLQVNFGTFLCTSLPPCSICSYHYHSGA